MSIDKKTEIVNSLIDIKLALYELNHILNNGQGYSDKDYAKLKLALDGCSNIAKIVRTA